ncbi:MAG: ECF transporter S component [Clostridiales bacterium]|nr:ECF transporter S component [Clostridiales bacterium]
MKNTDKQNQVLKEASGGHVKAASAEKNKSLRYNTRYITITAMLSAVSYVLMFFDFSVPFMPSFIKMDLSDLPELLGAFSMGPACGVLVCLVKNLLHLFQTSTGGVGELSNFLLGTAFVLPAGLIYKHKKTKRTALIGGITGAVVMGLFSIASNYFLVYPVYYNFLPKDTVLAAYQAILPGVKSILQCLVCFNAPFTMIKGFFSVAIAMFIYKPLSPILKGRDS